MSITSHVTSLLEAYKENSFQHILDYYGEECCDLEKNLPKHGFFDSEYPYTVSETFRANAFLDDFYKSIILTKRAFVKNKWEIKLGQYESLNIKSDRVLIESKFFPTNFNRICWCFCLYCCPTTCCTGSLSKDPHERYYDGNFHIDVSYDYKGKITVSRDEIGDAELKRLGIEYPSTSVYVVQNL